MTPGPLPSALPQQFLREASHPDPHFDYGVVVQITLTGFQPAEMVAPCCPQTLIWQNLTNAAQVLDFDSLGFKSAVIRPGGSYTYTPTVGVSLHYHSQQDPSQTGVVDLTPVEP